MSGTTTLPTLDICFLNLNGAFASTAALVAPCVFASSRLSLFASCLTAALLPTLRLGVAVLVAIAAMLTTEIFAFASFSFAL